MFRCARSAAASIVCAATSFGSVTLSVDLLGPEDGISLPPAGSGIAVVDVLVDVTQGDSWTVGGVAGVAMNGATLRYATDPSGDVILTNPGTDNRFVTFFTEPRGRDADDRYTSGGVVIGSNPVSMPDALDVVCLSSPPETLGSPTVDGAVARVALNIPNGREDFLAVFPLHQAPPGLPVYFRSENGGTVAGTFDVPSITGIGWVLVDLVPEPVSFLLLSLAALALWRRR